FRCGAPAVDHDRRAYAGNRASLGRLALESKLHPAMNNLRVVENLIKIVDGPCGDLLSFKLVEQLIALHARGERRQLSDQLLAVLETANVILVRGILRELRSADDVAKLDVLVVIAGRDNDVAV